MISWHGVRMGSLTGMTVGSAEARYIAVPPAKVIASIEDQRGFSLLWSPLCAARYPAESPSARRGISAEAIVQSWSMSTR